MKKLLILISAALLAGCTHESDFLPYAGAQPQWPVHPGGFTRVIDGVPIYRRGDFPPRPYDVLGAVITGSESTIAKLAKRHHADAAILYREDRRNPGLNITWEQGSANVQHNPFPMREVRAFLIKYRTP